MVLVKVESRGSARLSDIWVDDVKLTRAMAVTISLDPSVDYLPTVTVKLGPEHIVFEGEATVVLEYVDPITGESFTRETVRPDDEAVA